MNYRGIFDKILDNKKLTYSEKGEKINALFDKQKLKLQDTMSDTLLKKNYNKLFDEFAVAKDKLMKQPH